MEEFLRYVLSQLVEHPDDLIISHARTDTGKDIFRVSARKTDLPRIIGKSGHTIQAIRSLLSAAARKHSQRVSLEIVE